MKIHTATVGPFQENSYLAVDEQTGQGVIIDPGDEANRLARMIDEAECTLTAIWLTHAHLDHVGAVAGLKRKWNVPVLLHEKDLPLYRATDRQAAAYGIPFEKPPDPDSFISEGDVLAVGASEFSVMHVPGHAPGHVLFVGTGLVFGGDLLFTGSIGRTDLPLSNPQDMVRSLQRIAALPPGTIVYPGHGPPTSIARELEDNPFLNGMARVLGG